MPDAEEERRVLIAGLVALPHGVTVIPLRALAWRMAELAADHSGLSAVGAEAVVAAFVLGARVLGIRPCCSAVGVAYDALAR